MSRKVAIPFNRDAAPIRMSKEALGALDGLFNDAERLGDVLDEGELLERLGLQVLQLHSGWAKRYPPE